MHDSTNMTHDFDRLLKKLLVGASIQVGWKIDRLGMWRTFEARTDAGVFVMKLRCLVHERDLQLRWWLPRLVDPSS